MLTREDVESFLLRIDDTIDEVEPGMWVLGSDSGGLVAHYSPPLLILRAKVLALPADGTQNADLFRKLLELNASDLVRGLATVADRKSAR